MTAPRTLVLALVLAGCTDEGGPADGTTGLRDLGTGTDASGSDGASGPPVGEVYGSTQGTLYRLEPFSKAMTLVGAYDCIQLTPDPNDSQDGMADIAVDKDGQMYGIGRVKPTGAWMLVKVDRTTAHCTTVAPISGAATDTMTGLSFVPAGVIDPSSEVLVGLSHAGDLFRFDLATGAMTLIGNLGGSFASKGADLVSIAGDKTYTTSGFGESALLEIDPATATVTKTIGNTHVELIAGMGYWAGTLYGFDYAGKLFAIDRTTAVATEIAIPNPPADLRFWGAAVTTAAPVNVP